jgi:hypothetical protein
MSVRDKSLEKQTNLAIRRNNRYNFPQVATKMISQEND